MKIILLSLSLLATGLLIIACKQTKYTADKLPPKQIRWGNGGGFVGKETSHILLENGQIFGRDISGNTTEANKIKGKKAKAIFKSLEALGLAKMDFNHPGNTYSFLEYQEGDMVQRVVWGEKGAMVGKPIEELFGQLNGLLSK